MFEWVFSCIILTITYIHDNIEVFHYASFASGG